MNMFGLGHIDLAPLLYGVVMFVSLWLLYIKLCRLQIVSLLVSAFVFWLVFSLHGGSMTGGMAAMVCALLFDLIVFPPWRKA